MNLPPITLKNKVHLNPSEYYQGYPAIWFNTEIEKYPSIKSAREGDELIVTGLIKKVSLGRIELKLMDLKL